MAENDLIVYEQPKVVSTLKRNDYNITVGDKEVTLKRNIDFGKVPKAKSPSLWKAGAEKILMAFGLLYDVEITDSYKDYKNGFFYYECKATAYFDGKIVRVGVGCANTSESANGTASGFNQANSALKKAKKRAIVDLALTLGSLSDCFTQDFEDENFVNDDSARKIQGDNDPITTKQVQRIFAIAASKDISREKAKTLLTSWGVESTKDIKLKDYDAICEKLEHYGETTEEQK
jgi:hypothetical protein